MFEIFEFGFMQRAFAAGLVVALVCPVIGLLLVLRRLALIGDGLGHIAFGGVALGLFLKVQPVLSALGLALAGALGIERLRSRGRFGGDMAIAIFFSGGLALGVVFASLARSFNANLLGYLFGSLVTVSPTDLLLVLVLGALVLLAVLLLYKEYFFITFDEETARASGLPVSWLNRLLIVLTALTVVTAMRIVGLLLVSALIVLPVATSLELAKSFRQAMLLGMLFALIAVVGGLYAAYYLDIPAGGTIVLTAVGEFLVISLVRGWPRLERPS
jgi:zinc transport system permease protein